MAGMRFRQTGHTLYVFLIEPDAAASVFFARLAIAGTGFLTSPEPVLVRDIFFISILILRSYISEYDPSTPVNYSSVRLSSN